MKLSHVKSTPFKPFTARLSDGTTVNVPHEDFLLFLPASAGEVVIIVDEKGIIHLIDANHIVELNYNQ